MIVNSPAAPNVGIALAGGGPQGSVYELGAIRALDEALDGIDFNQVPISVGVSAGAFIAACLANGITSDQLCRAIVKHDPGEHPFSPSIFLSPAIGEMLKSASRLPRLVGEAVWDYAKHPIERRMLGSLTRLSRALPVGVFENEPLRSYLEKTLSRPGRTNDFRKLSTDLYIVAVDLDSGQPVLFGAPPYDHVPIATAVQASTALPGLYSPVEIDGRHYVDGVLLKTVHASVALENGADLVLCINPIVPVDTEGSVEQGAMRRGRLVHRGLPTVMSQTLRTIIRSRMDAGLAEYEARFKDKDVLVFEPDRDDYGMFFGNIFSFSKRKVVCDHAYRTTRRKLWENREQICPILERRGLRLRTELLEDDHRSVWDSVELNKRRKPTSSLTTRLENALKHAELLFQESE